MKTPSIRPARRRSGLAIVVVISLVALLTLLVLAFLLTSSANRNITSIDTSTRQAESIADLGKETIVADIFAEFAADTPSIPAPASDPSLKIFPVTNPTAMVPSRSLKDSALATDVRFRSLVKQSANGRKFASVGKTGSQTEVGAARASDVSTSAPEPGRRFVAAASWSMPALFGDDAVLSDTQVPDWIYIDRSGKNPGSSSDSGLPDAAKSLAADGTPNPNFIVGRYAYQIYNLGGLLDANVALYDPADKSTGSDAKDSPFWAVATSLPGASADLGKTLAGWRHLVGKANAAKPDRLVEDWAEPTGWTKVFSTASGTDQAFLTRQDLLRFQKANESTFPRTLLPYFTHANFSLNQAALRPPPNRPKVLALASGGNDGTGLDDALNPSFLALRSTKANWIAPGRPTVPVADRRFPLDRLDLVVPSTTKPDLVTQYFGLTFSNGEWTYKSSSIKRLPDVAAAGLEPDMFELLKATIHLGSIGVSGVPSGGVTSANRQTLDRSVNYHIVQLVANIIDQWDADSFPTIINFDGRKFYGIEDLPRIYYVRTACYRQKIIPPSTYASSPAGTPPPGYGSIYESVYLRQPILWNPHTDATVANSGDKPAEFRIIAISNQASGSGAADVKCQVYNGAGGQTPWKELPAQAMNDFRKANGPNFSQSPGPQKWDESTAFITFKTTATGPAAFRQPYPLKSPNYPSGSSAAGKDVFPVLSDTELSFSDAASKSAQVIGFFIGKVWTADNMFCLDPGLVIDNGIRYELQYKKGASWVTYDTMITDPYTGQDRTSFSDPFRRHFAAWFRLDPRTNRLGIFSTNNFRGWPVTAQEWQWNNGETGAPSTADGPFIGKPTPPPGWKLDAGNAVLPRFFQANLASGRGSYIDADGIIRPAMGADAVDVTGLPLANPPSAAASSGRPKILNRPFRSIAELGYVFRDIPWRQLDLSHAASEDGKLLDVFCLHSTIDYESPRIMRGRVNLNSAPAEVIAALVQGTSKGIDARGQFSSTEALQIGKSLADWTAGKTNGGTPLIQRGDLVGRTVGGASTGFFSQINNLLGNSDKPIEERRQALVRALADSSDTRTWNLMIDLVAQSGEMARSASVLKNFNSRAQVRRWIFLSIDRFTGEILHQSIETAAP